MEIVIKSNYLNEEQALEIRESFFAVSEINEVYTLVDKIGEYVSANNTSDERFERLFRCLSATKEVIFDEELSKMSALVFLAPSYGLTLLGLLILIGVFNEEDIRVAVSEKASLFGNKVDHSA